MSSITPAVVQYRREQLCYSRAYKDMYDSEKWRNKIDGRCGHHPDYVVEHANRKEYINGITSNFSAIKSQIKKHCNYAGYFGRALFFIPDFSQLSNYKRVMDWAKENCNPYQVSIYEVIDDGEAIKIIKHF